MKPKAPVLSIRLKLILSQAAIMAAILIVFTLVLSQLLNQVLNMNLDKFLHQQSDNFQSTITIKDNLISFHELMNDFKHSGSKEKDIPFYLQMVNLAGQTVMLSGNLEGRRLYHGSTLPNHETFETVFFFGKPSRRLTTPVSIHDRHIGWLIVTLPFDYLETFRNYKNKILGTATLIGIVLFTFLGYIFVRLALRPVKGLANSAEQLAQQSKIGSLPLISGKDEFTDLTQTLNNLLRKAGQSMETLELFAANVSHELKTPLALMHSEISLLQKKSDPSHQHSYDLLAQEVDRMQTLIDNLLVISHTQQPYQLLMTDTWLNDFISDEAGRLQRTFKQKNIHFDFSKVQSIKIKTDIYLLQLVIDNILRNAMLYSPPNSTITISSTESDHQVAIFICDEGPGIPESDLSKIFQPFVRGESTIHQVMKGSGLGLSISRWALDILGGTIKLENLGTGGLCASFTIPVQ